MAVIGRPHGVRGLVRVHSYTADPADLANYAPLRDDKGRQFLLTWRGPGIAAVCELRDGVAVPVADRETAARLANLRLYVERERLPAPEPEEFYVADLIGLEARDEAGPIGRVIAVHDHGAGASLEIEREGAQPLLVPFTRAAVPEVNVAAGRVVVSPPDEIDARPSRDAAA